MSERWNFEMQSGKLMVCHNNHDKGQPCEYKPAKVEDIEHFRKRISALEKVAEAAMPAVISYEGLFYSERRKLELVLRAAGYLKEQVNE